MRKKNVQMSLFDIYNDVPEAIENKKPKVISLLEEHIDWLYPIFCVNSKNAVKIEIIFLGGNGVVRCRHSYILAQMRTKSQGRRSR